MDEISIPIEKRNIFENLLLLCLAHHKIINDDPNTYTVSYLKEIKNNHLI